MGCASSRQEGSGSPDFKLTVPVRGNASLGNYDTVLRHHRVGFGELEKINEEPESENDESEGRSNRELGKPHKPSSKKAGSEKKAAFGFRFGRISDTQHVAAGWPSWLIAVAGEAIAGWLPLRSDLFEKLNKIGQGTYSSVYRARNLETGRIVALKKVRVDTFQPESVRFMAREITILRRLDHPNVMKLEGIITSRMSCNIYLVFEYMEHDLSGLLSCPEVKFSDAQIKCYMRQLLSGLEHCHSRGVMHRDIKSSNILVNNEGILKIADFGLANYLRHRQPLTSRVVTLWYRPPELLLGSTDYGPSVDLWSVGCVFSELFIGKPILKGRTEVEQLHKIFKLCGSPPDEYWIRSKLPLAAMFKPQQPYESTLRQRCKEFPKSAVNLIETFLSIEPYNRGTASSALDSEYFNTRPYACDPSSMPKYPPNKEMDAKLRDEARKRKAVGRGRASGSSRNQRRGRRNGQSGSYSRMAPSEDMMGSSQFGHRNSSSMAHALRGKGATECRDLMKSSYDTVSEAASQTTEVSQDASIRSVPVQVSASTDFAWASRRRPDPKSIRSYGQASSGSEHISAFHPSRLLRAMEASDSKDQMDEEFSSNFRSLDSYEIAKHAMRQKQVQHDRPESFRVSGVYNPQDLSVDYSDQQKRPQYLGTLPYNSHRTEQGQKAKNGLRCQGHCYLSHLRLIECKKLVDHGSLEICKA